MKISEDKLVLGRIVEAGRQRKISRRNFMQTATSAGLGAMAASTLWTTKVSAQTPSRGGTFRVGLHDGNTTDTMDPGKFQSVGEIQLNHAFRSYLTEITSDNALGGDMATGWEASADAKTWTFELSREAVFHNGRAFTAKDAVASLNHHRGEGNSSAAAPLLKNVTDIRADGDHAIVIELDQGFADLPWVMTDYHLAMIPANDDGSIDWQAATGAGPYKITEHNPGTGTLLERHDGWHREGAYFDAIEMNILNDVNARQVALVSGDIDAMSSIDLKTLPLLSQHPEIDVENVASGSAITLPMHCDTAPFDNVDVRLALKHAIDREDIIAKILNGAGTAANDFHISPNMPYWPDIEQRTYDPDKAKFHLKKAGMENLSVSVSAADSVLSGAVDMMVLFSEHAKAAGIDLTAVREPNDGYWSNVWLKKPFVFVKWGARPTPDNMFTLAYKSDAAWNEARWANERFDELLLQAKAEVNETLRAEMYREMSQIARDDGGSIIPCFVNFVYGRRKNVSHGDSVAASWELDGARAYHRWWFTS